MPKTKTDIIALLQKEILPLQGFRHGANSTALDVGLGVIKHSFPKASFPLGAVHEFFCTGEEDVSASSGFIAGILSSLMRSGSASLWISSSRMLFPPALKSFGIDPDKIIFIDLKKEKDVLWALEEALKCNGLAAVIGELQEISFTASRRLQLAIEQSGVTCFILRRNPRNLATACVTRWKITSLPGESEDDLPGLGFSRWKVELKKARNGKPGTWQIEWAAGKFQHVYTKFVSITQEKQKKAG